MQVFTSYRLLDKQRVEQVLNSLTDIRSTVEFIDHNSSNQDPEQWQKIVEEKILKSNKVLFLLNTSAAQSQAIEWEFDLVTKLNKPFRIIAFCTKNNLPKFVASYDEHVVKPSASQEIRRFLLSADKLVTTDELLLEQYKIMIASSEKVTEQRLKTNNLFFTITSTVLSFSMVLGKEFQFNELALIMMMMLAIISLISTFFWQKLISSYGCLNTGKFKVINEIEHRLKTNLFQREWDILINEVKYRSNTKTETTIVKTYRFFIIIILLSEISYTSIVYFKNEIKWLGEFLHRLL